jgi:hypothetical protein
MKNLKPSDEFKTRGGTELAPMSTTTDIKTAVEYSLSSESSAHRQDTICGDQRYAVLYCRGGAFELRSGWGKRFTFSYKHTNSHTLHTTS